MGDKSQKLAQFFKAKIGGALLTGALAVTPMLVGTGLYKNISDEIDMSPTTSESTQALKAYLARDDKMDLKYEKVKALEKTILLQKDAKSVTDMIDVKYELNKSLKSETHQFAIDVLNDTRLTERDYDKVEDQFKFDRIGYEKLNLPNVARSFHESAQKSQEALPLGTAEERAVFSRDNMMSKGTMGAVSTGAYGIFMTYCIVNLLAGGAGRKRDAVIKRLENTTPSKPKRPLN